MSNKLKKITVLQLIMFIIFITGAALLGRENWKILLGIFLMMWGNNAHIKNLK